MTLSLFNELDGEDGGLVNGAKKSRFVENVRTSSLELKVQTAVEQGMLKELELKLDELKESDAKTDRPAKPSPRIGSQFEMNRRAPSQLYFA